MNSLLTFARTIGALRTRLVLEAPIDVVDDMGGVSRTYQPLANVWGEIVQRSGDTRFLAGRQEEAITHRIRLRYRNGVNAQMRLRAGARIFTILAVFDTDERRRTLVCQCEEVKP